jgi:hypothetical protein
MATEQPLEIFAVDFAALAREIAFDIFPMEDIIALHKLSDEEWAKIQANQRFQQMLASMTREWASAANTRERVKMKAATGLESVLETYIREIIDPQIPLTQRVEAGKFLAKLGELGPEAHILGGAGGSSVTINISTGGSKPPLTIEGGVLPEPMSIQPQTPEDAEDDRS